MCILEILNWSLIDYCINTNFSPKRLKHFRIKGSRSIAVCSLDKRVHAPTSSSHSEKYISIEIFYIEVKFFIKKGSLP